MPPIDPKKNPQQQKPSTPGKVQLQNIDQNEPVQGLPNPPQIQTHQPNDPAARVVNDSAEETLTPEQVAAKERNEAARLQNEQAHKEVEEQIPDKPGVIGVVETKRLPVGKPQLPEKSDETPKSAHRNWNEGDRNEIMQVESAPTPPYVASQNYQGQPPPPTPGHGEPVFAIPKRDENGQIMRTEDGDIIYTTKGVEQQNLNPVQVSPAIEAKQLKAGMLPRNRNFAVGDRMQKFEVSLRDCPTLRIWAGDRLEAIQIFNQHCGIIKTENPHTVVAVT